MLKFMLLITSWFFSMYLWAFPCFLTLVKDNCWTNYNLSVTLSDAVSPNVIATINIPQGQSWSRQAFECQPSETLSVIASFTPEFWQSDKGKTYPGRRNWQLPSTVSSGDTAWNITICYASDFLSIPLPPEASGNCVCETDNIPPVKPQ